MFGKTLSALAVIGVLLGAGATHAVAQEAQPTAIQPQAQPVAVRIVEDPIPSYKNRVSVGPIGMLFGVGNFTYERGLSDKFSVEISPSFIYWGFGDSSIYGGSLGLGASVYFTGDAPRGLRVNATVMPGFIGASDADEDVFMFGAKLMFGYNWIWNNGFTLGLHGGMQYLHFELDGVDSALNGVLPAIDFNLGFAF